ncbi:MAG: hypothetical protein WAN35_04850, partial [Terracidiphilus sp.]
MNRKGRREGRILKKRSKKVTPPPGGVVLPFFASAREIRILTNVFFCSLFPNPFSLSTETLPSPA